MEHEVYEPNLEKSMLANVLRFLFPALLFFSKLQVVGCLCKFEVKSLKMVPERYPWDEEPQICSSLADIDHKRIL